MKKFTVHQRALGDHTNMFCEPFQQYQSIFTETWNKIKFLQE